MNKSHYLRGVICALTGGIAWGFSGACGQLLTGELNINPLYITFLRLFFAGLILVFVSIIKNPKETAKLFKNKESVLRLILFSIFGLLLSQFSYLKAISYSNAATATVLQYIGPVMIMIFVCLKTRTLPTKKEATALISAFFGVYVLATHFDFSSLALSKECLFWGLFAALSLVFYSLLPIKLFKEYSTITITGWGMLIGSFLLMSIAKPWNSPDITLTSLLPILGMVLVGTVFAYTIYMQGVSDIGAVRASMIACIEPVSAALFSFFWLKTKFLMVDIWGFILILLAVFLLKKDENK